MDVTEALSVLGIDSIDKCNLKYIRKSYKNKIKTCHPDLGNDIEYQNLRVGPHELGAALLILKEKLEKLNSSSNIEQFYNEYKYQKGQIVISLNDILNVYKNNIVYDSLGIELTKQRLKSENIIFTLDVQFKIKGLSEIKTYRIKKVLNDTYTIVYDIFCDIGDTVEISMLDITKNIVINSNRCTLNFNFDFLINVQLVVDRKEREV